MQQPRPPRPSTQRTSLDALYFGRAADSGEEPCPPQQFWAQLAAARERVNRSSTPVSADHNTVADSVSSELTWCTSTDDGIGVMLPPAFQQSPLTSLQRAPAPIQWPPTCWSWLTRCHAGAQQEARGGAMGGGALGEKLRTSLDVKRAVEAVRSDFLHTRRCRGDPGASSSAGAAPGRWDAAQLDPIGGTSALAQAQQLRLEAAAAALAASMPMAGSARRGSQASSRCPSGSTVHCASYASQQDAWGLVQGGAAHAAPPPQTRSVSRSSIKRTSVDLTHLDDRQLAAAAVPASAADQFMDTLTAEHMAPHALQQQQAPVRGSMHFHHPSNASVGSLMDWTRPGPPVAAAAWSSVGCNSADSVNPGMLRRATPSAPYLGASGGVRRSSATASVSRSSLPSSIKRASGSGVRSALGPVSFGPPGAVPAFLQHPAPPPPQVTGGQNPFETRGHLTVARRSFQRPVRSEAVANLLSDGPVRSAPIREVLQAEGSAGLGPLAVARRPHRSVRAASEGGRRGAVAHESFLATAARLSARIARPGEDVGVGKGGTLAAMTQLEPSDGSLTSMCAARQPFDCCGVRPASVVHLMADT